MQAKLRIRYMVFWPLAKPLTWSAACVSLSGWEAEQSAAPSGLLKTQAEGLNVKGGQNPLVPVKCVKQLPML